MDFDIAKHHLTERTDAGHRHRTDAGHARYMSPETRGATG